MIDQSTLMMYLFAPFIALGLFMLVTLFSHFHW